jgi:hypothetical protein
MGKASRRKSSPRPSPTPEIVGPVSTPSEAMQKIATSLQEGVNVYGLVGQKEIRIATLEQALNGAVDALRVAEVRIKEYEDKETARQVEVKPEPKPRSAPKPKLAEPEEAAAE